VTKKVSVGACLVIGRGRYGSRSWYVADRRIPAARPPTVTDHLGHLSARIAQILSATEVLPRVVTRALVDSSFSILPRRSGGLLSWLYPLRFDIHRLPCQSTIVKIVEALHTQSISDTSDTD
jgi:hypothetical protein